MFKGKSKVAFTSALLGVLYGVYLISYFFGGTASTSGTEQAGAALATAIVMPHMVVELVAAIINVIAFLGNKKWAIITALVLYCVSAVLFPLYFFFVIPMIILSAVAIGKISKINKAKETSSK